MDKIPDICLTVEGKPQKTLKQENDPTGLQTRDLCVRGYDVTPQRWSDRFRYFILGNLF